MAVANFSDKTDLPLRVGREKTQKSNEHSNYEGFWNTVDIWTQLAGPEHTGVYAWSVCVWTYRYSCVCDACVRACVRRSERLSKYNRYNHGRTLLLARQVVRSGRAHAVHVGWQSLQTVGVCVVGLPPLNSSAPHRFRHYYYFDIVSSCVLVAKCDNYLLIGGFSVGRGIFLTMVTACFILLSHDTVQTPFKVTESHLSILWSTYYSQTYLCIYICT